MFRRLRERSRRYRVPLRRYGARWRELIHDSEQPGRTAVGFSLGALLGATPVLGLHTWMAVASAVALRLPPLAVVLGSNLSNPITFIPLTLLEVRVGAALLGKPFHALPEQFDVSSIGDYLLEAWVGWLVVGTAMAIGSFSLVRVVQRLVTRSPSRTP